MAPCRRLFARASAKNFCRRFTNFNGHSLAPEWSGSREGEAGTRRRPRGKLASCGVMRLAAANPAGVPAARMWIRARSTKSRVMKSARVSRSAQHSTASAPRKAHHHPRRPRAIGHTAIVRPAPGHPATGHSVIGHAAIDHPATDHVAVVHPETGRSASVQIGRSRGTTDRQLAETGHPNDPGNPREVARPVRRVRREEGRKDLGNLRVRGNQGLHGNHEDRRVQRVGLKLFAM
jgi:hypothetical protein